MIMTFEEIQELVKKDEHRCLELKKTTGELQDGMHSACAFLNMDGDWLGFAVRTRMSLWIAERLAAISSTCWMRAWLSCLSTYR